MKKFILLTIMSVAAEMAVAQTLSVCYGNGYILNSKADAVAASGEVTYSWYEDGDLLDGENASSLTIAAGKALGDYAYVRMAAGEDCPDGVPSNTFTVTVNPVPAIHTASQTVNQGTAISTITYTASAGAVISMTGSLPPGVIGDASGSSFTISGTPSGTGTFGYALTSTLDECVSAVTAGTITVTVGIPPGAASTQMLVLGTQTWSDRIVIPANCASAATLSTAESLPAQYKVSSGRYYYNWACVNTAQTTLCPDPWRVPSQSDFNTLITNFGGDIQSARDAIIAAWGFGGFANGSSTDVVNEHAYYWSSTAHSTDDNYAYYMAYHSGLLHVSNHYKYNGFQVRCVK